MNKTISINLAGLIFHIEEEAYEILKAYINTLKQHFSTHPDSQEIITDLENRVAETFTEITKEKQFISKNDIENIIAQIGKIEDFEAEEQDEAFEARYNGKSSKRKLFRDRESQILGGVCSGFGKYFEVDPIWLRLIWFASVVFFGFGFLLYIFFWIIIPEAKTRADKLQMEGKPYTLNNLKETIEKEFENISTRTKNGQIRTKLSDFIVTVVEIFVQVFGKFFKIIGKAIGVIFLFIGIIVGSLIAVQLFDFFINKQFSLSWVSPSNFLMSHQFAEPMLQNGFLAAALFTVLIPVVLMFLGGINLLFQIKTMNKVLSGLFAVTFVISLVFTLYYGSKILMGFKYQGTVVAHQPINTTPSNTYYLKFNHQALLEQTEMPNARISANLDGEDFHWEAIEFNIYNSKSSETSVKKKFHARGGSSIEAFKNAKEIDFNITQLDSIILIDRLLNLPKQNQFRGQNVVLNFNFPDGTTLYIDEEVSDYFNNIGNLECAYSSDETLCLIFENGKVFCKNTLDL